MKLYANNSSNYIHNTNKILVIIITLWAAIPARSGDECVFINQSMKTGIPLGGLGAGYIELQPNGTTERLVVNNNWANPIVDAQGLTWAVAVSKDGQVRGKSFRAHPGPVRGIALPERAFEAFRFQGRFPVVEIDAEETEFPVTIHLKAWSPFVPGDPETSSHPIAVFDFELTNTSSTSIQVSLAGCWEHIMGLDGMVSSNSEKRQANRIHPWQKGGYYGLQFARSGDATNEAPVNAFGEHLLVVKPEKNDMVSALVGFDPNHPEVFWTDFEDDGLLRPWENIPAITPAGSSAESDGAIAVHCPLEPGEIRTISFALTWHMPHLVTRQGDLKAWYTNHTDSAVETAMEILSDAEDYFQSTTDWQTPFQQSTLPSWYLDAFYSSLQVFITNTVRTQSGTFGMLSSIDGRGDLGSVPARLLYQPALLAFFPTLDASELKSIRNLQLASGEVPHLIGSLHEAIGAADVTGGITGEPDLGCAYVIQLDRYLSQTGDGELIQDTYMGAHAAMEWVAKQDGDGDGIPEGNAMFGIGKLSGAFVGNAELWLAALQASDRLADWAKDAMALSNIPKWRLQAREGFQATLWNGRYFAWLFNPTDAGALSGSEIFLPQLLGRWTGLIGGWPLTIPDDIYVQNLNSVYELTQSSESPLALRLSPQGTPTQEEIWPYHTYAGLVSPLLSDGLGSAGRQLLQRVLSAAQQTPLGHWASPRQVSIHLESARGLRAAESLAVVTFPQISAGFSLDLVNKEITVGPKSNLDANENILPIVTPHAWFELRYQNAPLTPTQQAELRVIRLLGKEPIAIDKISWRIPKWMSKDSVELIVETQKGIPGVTSSDTTKAVCLFPKGIKLKEGDSFYLTLNPARGPYLHFDIDKRILQTRGLPVQAIPIPGIGPDRFGYFIRNLTDRTQYVTIHFAQGKKEKNDYLIHDGIEQPISVSQETTAELILPVSPLDRESRTRWNQFRIQIEQLILEIGQQTQEKQLLAALAQIHQEVVDILYHDGLSSQQRILIAPEAETAKLDKTESGWKKDDFNNTIKKLHERIQDLQVNVNAICSDSRLAAMTVGALLPVELTTDIVRDDTWRGDSAEIIATVATYNPIRFQGKVNLQVPTGWNADSDGSLDITADNQTGPVWTRRFLVSPPQAVQNGRQMLSIEISGQTGIHDATSPVFNLEPRSQPDQSARKSTNFFRKVSTLFSKNNPNNVNPVEFPPAYFRRQHFMAVGAGFVREWNLIGPFDNKGGTGFDTYYDPEIGVNLSEPVDGKEWFTYHSTDGFVNLNSIFQPNQDVLSYAYVYAIVPRPVPAMLRIGVAGGIKIFFNRSEVFASRSYIKMNPGEISVPVDLREGWNELLLKVTQSTGPWEFCVELTDRQGLPINGLRWSNVPPISSSAAESEAAPK